MPGVTGVWDVAVVGAGPAGASAALAALARRPDARVLLLDRADFPRDKACGDGIAPHALDVLADLGVPDAAAGHPPVHRLRLGVTRGPEVAARMARPAHVVPRAVLDARLVAAATARGARLERRTVRRVERRGGLVVLDGEVSARAVVGADGASSVVRRALGLAPNPRGHVAVALRGYAPVGPGRAFEQVICASRRDWPAYAWSFPIGDGRANVGYGEVLRGAPLTRARLLAGLEELLPGAGAHAGGLRAHHLPLSSRRPRQPDGPVLLAGDAMSLVNPMSGEGIYYAVLSGACAGEAALAGAAAGARYRARLRRELGRHLRHTTAAAALARSPRVLAAAVAAGGRDQGAFDALVELALGRGTLAPRLLLRLAAHPLHPPAAAPG